MAISHSAIPLNPPGLTEPMPSLTASSWKVAVLVWPLVAQVARCRHMKAEKNFPSEKSISWGEEG